MRTREQLNTDLLINIAGAIQLNTLVQLSQASLNLDEIKEIKETFFLLSESIGQCSDDSVDLDSKEGL